MDPYTRAALDKAYGAQERAQPKAEQEVMTIPALGPPIYDPKTGTFSPQRRLDGAPVTEEEARELRAAPPPYTAHTTIVDGVPLDSSQLTHRGPNESRVDALRINQARQSAIRRGMIPSDVTHPDEFWRMFDEWYQRAIDQGRTPEEALAKVEWWIANSNDALGLVRQRDIEPRKDSRGNLTPYRHKKGEPQR